MFRHQVRISGDSDPAALVSQVEKLCASLPDRVKQTIVNEVRDLVHQLHRDGKRVEAVGGQFHATKTVEEEGCRVLVRADFGPRRKGLLNSLRGFLSGRR